MTRTYYASELLRLILADPGYGLRTALEAGVHYSWFSEDLRCIWLGIEYQRNRTRVSCLARAVSLLVRGDHWNEAKHASEGPAWTALGLCRWSKRYRGRHPHLIRWAAEELRQAVRREVRVAADVRRIEAAMKRLETIKLQEF